MLQFGVLMIAMAIHSFYIGRLVSGLVCLSAGLLFISSRKIDLRREVNWKNLGRPVDDDESIGPLEAAAGFASWAVFAVAVFVAVSSWLDTWR